jgi:hypothetical protein
MMKTFIHDIIGAALLLIGVGVLGIFAWEWIAGTGLAIRGGWRWLRGERKPRTRDRRFRSPTHIRLWLWYYLYDIEWIRRYVPTPPKTFLDRMTPEQRQAFHEWKINTFECHQRIHGPRTEYASPYDPRWPLSQHDEQALLALKRRKDDLRARGYGPPVVRGGEGQDDEAWLADWREWHERQR